MSDTPTRRSPIHHLLQARNAQWCVVGGMQFAVRLGTEEAEQAAKKTLGLCDLSGLTKLGIKGADAESWLAEQNIDVPKTVYESQRLADGGFIVRVAAEEFLLESGIANTSVPALADRLDSHSGRVLRIERQEATFLLVGSRANDVLSQTCGIDFHNAVPQQLVLTRVAGVSCGVLPHRLDDTFVYRFWIDFSYAVYLWETLAEICESLGGSVIGAGCLFPELLLAS